MTTWTFPSAQFPPPAGVTLRLPDPWHRIERAGAVIAAQRPGSPEVVPATLVVTVRRVPPGTSFDAVVKRFRVEMGDYPEAVVSREMQMDAPEGIVAYGHEMAYVMPNVGTLVQSSRLLLAGTTAPTLVVAQATVGSDRVHSDFLEVQQALDTIEVSAG